jgi:hypothetical protein
VNVVLGYAAIGGLLGAVSLYRNARLHFDMFEVYTAIGIAVVWPIALLHDVARMIHERRSRS